jgi:SAM-dependent methyltransferase
MGLSVHVAEMLIREHLYKPLPTVVHTVGRLVMGFSFEEISAAFHRVGVQPHPVKVEIDRATKEATVGIMAGKNPITDRTFFGMLGVQEVCAIDISNYEGASIIWDMCRPVPDTMADMIEFVVGGSTLDNVWDPAQYMRNMARMLKPGGRMLEINHGNDRVGPYVILPPAWYFDFFCINRFADCKTYVLEYDYDLLEDSYSAHLYKMLVPYNPQQQVGWGLIENFEDDRFIHTVLVLAEKGPHSTYDQAPVQAPYRNFQQVQEYGKCLRELVRAPRPFVELPTPVAKPIGLDKKWPPRNYHYVGGWDD